MAAAAITGAVGPSRANAPIDVALVEDLLNRAQSQEPAIAVDGLTTGPLFTRIEAFQGKVMKLAHPDSRVDPGGRTWQALSQQARKVPVNPKLVQGSDSWGAWGSLDVDNFADLYTRQFKETRPGLKVLLTAIRDDPDVPDIRWAAYMLATAWKETFEWIAGTRFEPVKEVGGGRSHRVRDVNPATKDKLKFKATDTAKASQAGTDYGYGDVITFVDAAGQEHDNVYFGRGYVQITWWDNYLYCGQQLNLGEALAIDPDKVLEPDTAYKIMSGGMRDGWFTRNARMCLSHFIHDEHCDYYNARQIINGHDAATEIADMAKKLEMLLRIVSG
jgi:hypothetical protein